MPRNIKMFVQLQKFAGQALIKVRAEIRSKTTDLRQLKEEEGKLVTVTGLGGVTKSDMDKRRTRSIKKRID
jgi:hypothetical protein